MHIYQRGRYSRMRNVYKGWSPPTLIFRILHFRHPVDGFPRYTMVHCVGVGSSPVADPDFLYVRTFGVYVKVPSVLSVDFGALRANVFDFNEDCEKAWPQCRRHCLLTL